MNQKPLKIYVLLFAGAILLSFVAAKFGGIRLGFFYAAGCALGFGNLWILQFSWKRILQKKDVVLGAVIIVSKYAIFGLIIYVFLAHPELMGSMGEKLGFAAGLGSVLAFLTIFHKAVREGFEESTQVK